MTTPFVTSTRTSSALRLFLPILLVVGLAFTPARAQQAGEAAPNVPALRDGVYFSLGLGSASVSASCASCGELDFFSDRINGFAGTLQLGGVVTPRLVIAGEFSGWIRNDELLNRRIAAVNLVFLGYPSQKSGFFIRSGIGGLRAVAETDFDWVQTDAFTSQTGIGYDIPLGDTFLTPYVTYIRTFAGETWFNGFVSPETVYPNAFQVGVAFTVH